MHKLIKLFLLQATALLVAGSLTAQTPPPRSLVHDPTGVVNQVEVDGTVLRGYGHEFYSDGTWEMWDSDGLVGYGTWEQDLETGYIHYVNESGDGGGGQTGKYERDGTVWERTEGIPP